MTQDGLSSSLPQPTPKNFRIDYEGSLNPQQLSAVKSVQGPYLVIAGAGTGKTRTLVYRVAYLVESGLNPRNILLLTFSRRAARQMMKRASGILDNRCLNVSGGTFHAFANNVLRQFSHHIGFEKGFTIADRADAEDMIGSIRAEIGVAKKDKRTPLKKTICAVLSKGVNTGMSYEKIITRDYPQFIESLNLFCSLAEAYKSFKLARGIMDYDDLLVNLKELLLNHHEIRRGLSWHSRFIMVDEYQDTNRLQAEIVSLLASEHENIMVVGDDSQGIYSFRGADHKNIMEFPSLFPKATIIMLEQNYRSTQPILTLTNSIVSSMKEKYEKKLLTTIPHGEKPIFFIAGDIFEQASFVCEQVLKLREEGVRLRDIAVLYNVPRKLDSGLRWKSRPW